MLVMIICAPALRAGSGPPATYKLADVTIRIERGYHAYTTKYEDSVTLSGTGTCDVKQNDSGTKLKKEFRLDRHIVQALLRELYDLHFFDLKDSYTTRPQLVFDDDGGVETRVSIINHQFETQVTVSIGAFSKSIRFDAHGLPPEELKRFADRVYGLLREYVPEFRQR